MARQLPINVEVVDQFPVYELDEWTKRSGLVQGDFDVVVYLDGVEQAAFPFAIAEIGTSGEYALSFTPTAVGGWMVDVRVPYNEQEWYVQVDSVDETTSSLYELVRRALGLIHENVFIDETIYDATGQMTSSRVRLFGSAADVDLATDGGSSPPDPDPIAVYRVDVTWEGLNQYAIFKQKLTSP